MASRPKRKRTTRDVSTERPATISADISQETVQPSRTPDVEEMVTACMAAIAPTIVKTCRDILSQKNAVSSTATSSTDVAMASNSTSVRDNNAEESTVELLPAQSLLQDITGTSPSVGSYYSSDPKHASATLLTLGVDDKTRSKIYAGEYVKFSSLLPLDPNSPAKNQYRSVEQAGQLVFLKSNEKDSINTITKWTEAYQVFVAIYAEKYPLEIGNLMVYAQTVQKIAESCGDQAALQYDEKFRRWRQKDPSACPWQSKNPELYQEALVLGLDYKFKSKKPQPFRAPLKHRYCFSYNNFGTCPKNNSCPHPHVCQICAGKHWRKLCPRFKQDKSKQTKDNSSNAPKPTTSVRK